MDKETLDRILRSEKACSGEHPKESIFQYEDGKWGWYDETWNPGDDTHYETRDAAQKALSKYCTEVLGI